MLGAPPPPISPSRETIKSVRPRLARQVAKPTRTLAGRNARTPKSKSSASSIAIARLAKRIAKNLNIFARSAVRIPEAESLAPAYFENKASASAESTPPVMPIEAKGVASAIVRLVSMI